MTEPPRTLSSDSLSGTRVVDPKGGELGNVRTLMIDLDGGRVVYGVLSFGGFLGFGDKLFAVPWNSLEIDTEREVFVLDMDEERLRRMPGFDKDDWPDFADERFHRAVHTAYGQTPPWRGIDHVGT